MTYFNYCSIINNTYDILKAPVQAQSNRMSVIGEAIVDICDNILADYTVLVKLRYCELYFLGLIQTMRSRDKKLLIRNEYTRYLLSAQGCCIRNTSEDYFNFMLTTPHFTFVSEDKSHIP